MVQHAIITGGSSGIGLAVAQRLADQGTNLSIIGRTQAKLEAAQSQIEAKRRSPTQQVLIFAADVADRVQAETAIQAAIAQLGAPDLLVTCAGIARPGYFGEMPIDVFERTMAVNYFGSLYCIRAVLPAMEQRQQGHLVLVSSLAGLIGVYGYTAYSPSKFAVRGLAESLRGELKPKGIGVSLIYPPDTDTPQLAEENKTKPLATQRITATTELWSADRVAQVLLEGVQRQLFVITPGLGVKLFNRWHSVVSSAFNWYFDRIVANVN